MYEYISHRGNFYDHQLLYLNECKGEEIKLLAC